MEVDEGPPAAAQPSSGIIRIGAGGPGKGADQGPDRPGSVPEVGFQAVTILVSSCTNEKSNGVYSPAKPFAGKAVWYKVASEKIEHTEDGKEVKDRGERFIYKSENQERWFIGDALEAGGFSAASSPGQSIMPPLEGWANGAIVEFQSVVFQGDLNAAAALKELPKLLKIDPWEDQEVCYVTLLKVLGNIAANPGEPKFCSIKIENPGIQKKLLRFDGVRGFLEAVGFRENEGALVMPVERHNQAQMAREMLQGFADEAAYNRIRRERHAKASEETKKQELLDKQKRPAFKKDAVDYEDTGSKKFGPQRG